MKPNDLLDAMGRISSEYVTEAKPAPKQQTDARTAKYGADGTAEPVTVSRGDASAHHTTEKDYIMKKNTIMRRITTGFAAAAACAVFACGGWFIYKQAQQQKDPEPESQSVSEVSQTESSTPDVLPADTNFLGGKGQLHVLRCRVLNEGSPADILYDDTRWYFRSGACYAERNGEAVTEFHDMPAEKAEFYSHVLYDECGGFFYADGLTLYKLENDGTHPEEPFFTIDSSGGDSTYANINIIRMTDKDYLISVTGVSEPGLWIIHTDGSADQLAELPDYDDNKFLRSEDGTVYAPVFAPEGGHNGIVSFSPDGIRDTITPFTVPNDFVEYMSEHDGKLYVLISCGNADAPAPQEYAEIDLETHDIGWMQPVFANTDPFVRNVLTNGKQDFVIKHSYEQNSDVLYSTDPAWENQQELFRFDASAELPDAVKARRDEAQRQGYMILNIWADERYLMMQLTGRQYALYDMETGRTQYYFAERMPAGEVGESDVLHVDESQYTELDPGFTGTNFLGGQGSLHIPKTSVADFMYDDTCYYFFGLIFPRTGNQCVEYSGDPDYEFDLGSHYLFSDGERLYVTKNGAVNLIDSSGRLTPFFRLSDVGLEEGAEYTNVFRIGSSYLFSTGFSLQDDTDGVSMVYGDYVWVDANGRPLGDMGKWKNQDTLIPGSTDGGRSKYVYFWNPVNSEQIHRLADPASGEAQLDFTLPDWQVGGYNNAYGRFSAVVDDKFLYLDKNGAFCAYEPDTGKKAVLVGADNKDAAAMGYCSAVIDGKIYYMLHDPEGDQPNRTNLMQYDLNSGERQTMLSFDTALFDNPGFLWQTGSKLVLETIEGLILYDPATGEWFRLYD